MDMKTEPPPLTISALEVEHPCACGVSADENANTEPGGKPLDDGVAAQRKEDSMRQMGHEGFR